jgi:hypothetical protein
MESANTTEDPVNVFKQNIAQYRRRIEGGHGERTSVAGWVHLPPGSIHNDVRESWVIYIHGRLRQRRCVSAIDCRASYAVDDRTRILFQ